MKMKEARLAAGLGRNKLSKLSGVGVDSILRFETDKKAPNLETMVKLCRGLELDRETILQIDEFKHITEPLVEIGLIDLVALASVTHPAAQEIPRISGKSE